MREGERAHNGGIGGGGVGVVDPCGRASVCMNAGVSRAALNNSFSLTITNFPTVFFVPFVDVTTSAAASAVAVCLRCFGAFLTLWNTSVCVL